MEQNTYPRLFEFIDEEDLIVKVNPIKNGHISVGWKAHTVKFKRTGIRWLDDLKILQIIKKEKEIVD